ncbi:MAG TPA: SdrD B-like domain-containing protein [Herpetosiphonaceae bacterium]
MPRFRLRRSPTRTLLLLGLLGTVLLGLSGYPLTAVQAQLDPNQPALAYASTVDCIRAGADRGLASHASPRFATTCFGSRWSPGGYTDPSVSNQGDAIPGDPAILEFGDGKPDAPGEPGHLTLSTLGEAGAVYGIASSSGTNPAAPAGAARQARLFVGAFTKRITRFGPSGPGGISVVNRASGATTPFVVVPDVVPGPNGLPGDPGDGSAATFPNGLAYTPQNGGLHTQFEDQVVLPYTSKTSLGDVEIDADERFLYAVNLNTRRIYRFDTWSASPQSSMSVLPQVPNPAICASGAGDFRPFALHLTRISLYLGYTCSAESSGDRSHLSAGVWRYDLTTGSWSGAPAVAFNLRDYDAQRGSFAGLPLAWLPWDTQFASVHPLPLLTDLVFDESGAMLIGLRDRYGDNGTSYLIPSQQGRGFGDLLRAEPSGFGQWSAPTTGAEVYADDDPATHNERTWGGLAYVPGRHDGSYGGEVITTFLTPYQLNAAGAAWYDAAGGAPTAREELYNATNDASFAKTAGLGDVELLCPWRAVGDRVWLDTNANGIQDAGEADIQGVRVQLFAASDTAFATPLATITTGSVAGMSGNWRIYVDPWQSYVARIDPQMFAPGQPLAGLRLTVADRGANDGLDSDASPAGVIPIPSGANGDLNTSFDAGLTSVPLIGDRVWRDADGDGVQDAGESGIAGVTVELLSASGAIVGSTTTDASGLYFFDVQPNTTYTVRLAVGNFAAGGPLADLILSPQNRGGNDATDSDADQINRSIGVPGQPAGGSNLTFDVGLMATTFANGTVGNYVWNDDGDGRQETGEPGVEGVTVRLIDTATGAVVATTTTSASGVYQFPNVVPGTYVVEFVPPAGAQPTPRDASGVPDDLDSDADAGTSWRTASFTVIADTDNQTLDLGLILPVNVRLTKSAPATVVVGQTLTYTLTYTNTGPGLAQSVTITDTLPSGLTFVSATPAPASQTGQNLSWNLGTLAPGQSGTIAVQTTVAATAPATLTNTARIATTSSGDDPSDNTGTATTTVLRVNVRIQKSGPATAVAGDQFSYTLDYANTSAVDAAGVVVSDTLPSGLTFVSATPAPSSQAGQVLTWAIGDVPANASGRIALVVRSDPATPTGTQVTNTARVSTTTPGDDPGDNTSSATTTVSSPTAVQLAYFRAERQAGGVLVRWGTLAEQDTQAFRILRGTGPDRTQATVVSTVLAQGSQGGDYAWTDTTAPAVGLLYYWLVEVEVSGAEQPYGPATAGTTHVFLPIVR